MTPVETVIHHFFRSIDLECLLTDPGVTEIMVVGGNRVSVERNGKIADVANNQITEGKLRAAIEIIARSLGNDIDVKHPILDARLPDGSRVCAVVDRCSPLGSTLTIRKFLQHFTTDELIERGALTRKTLAVVLDAIHDRRNVLVSGGTASGKTTLCNAFIRHVPMTERLIVIERPIEMHIEHPRTARWEACRAIAGMPEITVSDLLSAALRSRPDRIIIGEVRNKEAYDMLQAMNTGHSGTFCTVHSDTATTALNRIANLARPGFEDINFSRQETAAAINLVVHARRTQEGKREVSEIIRVDGYDEKHQKFVTEEVYTA